MAQLAAVSKSEQLLLGSWLNLPAPQIAHVLKRVQSSLFDSLLVDPSSKTPSPLVPAFHHYVSQHLITLVCAYLATVHVPSGTSMSVALAAVKRNPVLSNIRSELRLFDSHKAVSRAVVALWCNLVHEFTFRLLMHAGDDAMRLALSLLALTVAFQTLLKHTFPTHIDVYINQGLRFGMSRAWQTLSAAHRVACSHSLAFAIHSQLSADKVLWWLILLCPVVHVLLDPPSRYLGSD
jgi:hypothetical protein